MTSAPDSERASESPGPEAEAFVRRELGALEASLRELALVALADWERVGHAPPELFRAIASLQRPSWGNWNGLLSALRRARRTALRTAPAELRARVEAAEVLGRVLAALEERVDPELSERLRPLAQLTRAQLPRRLTVHHALALPIALRNQVAHDAPDAVAWWEEAAEALRPLVRWVAEADPAGAVVRAAEHPAPWFLHEDGETWAFTGVARDSSASYVSPQGERRHEEASHELLRSFQRLLGRTELQEADFRKLMGRLAPRELKGVMLGDYLVGPPVGEGGFAVVHEGRQLSTGRKVAVKILRDGMDEDVRARFQQEAAFLSSFDHPHIVRVLGHGEGVWTPPARFSLSGEAWFAELERSAPVKSYIALEWVDGETLDAVERPAERELVEWFAQTAEALAAVHAVGLLHRDVKPSNIMITSAGDAKLMDFGIARRQSEHRTLMTVGTRLFGTLGYMSPEQLRAADGLDEAGPASDVYSLCASFYEAFTGRRVYDHDVTPLESVRARKLAGELPARPRSLSPAIPWEIATLLIGGLQPEVDDRPRSMEALARDLRRYLADEPIHYRRPGVWRRLQLGYRRNRAVSNLAIALTLLLSVAAVFYVRSLVDARADAETEREHAEQSARKAADSEAAMKRQLAALYTEQGRVALLSGDRARAFLFLFHAYELGDRSPAVRYMLAQATSSFESLGARLTGHVETVGTVSPSPDGAHLATLTDAGVVRVWDGTTGAPEATLRVPDAKIDGLAWAPDGPRLLTWTRYQDVAQVWSAATGALERTLGASHAVVGGRFSADGRRIWLVVEGVGDEPPVAVETWEDGARVRERRLGGGIDMVKSPALSADGRHVAFADDRSRTIRLWSTEGGPPRAVLATCMFANGTVVFSPDGRGLAVTCMASSDPSVLWDAESGRPLRTLGDEDSSGAAFSGGGGRVVSWSWRSATVWDADGRPVQTIDPGQPMVSAAALDQEGEQLAIGTREGPILLYDVASGRRVASFSDHSKEVAAVAFSPDGKTLYSGGADRLGMVWHIAPATSGSEHTLGGHRDYLTGVAWSPDGARLASIGSGGLANLWDAASGRRLASMEVDGEPRTALFVDDTHLLTASRNGEVAIWDGAGRKALTLDALAGMEGLIHRSDSLANVAVDIERGSAPRILVIGTGVARITTLEAGLAAVAEKVDLEGTPKVRAARLLGRGAVAVSEDGRVRFWDSAGKSVRVVDLEAGPLRRLAVSADQRRVAVAGPQLGAALLDASDGRVVATLTAHTGGVDAVAFGAGLLATAGADSKARLWDADTGELRVVLDHYGAGGGTDAVKVTAAAFTPDGSLLVTGSDSSAVYVWETSTGRLLAQRARHELGVVDLAIAPSGTMGASVGGRTTSTWKLALERRDVGELRRLLARHVPWRLEEGRVVPAH